MLHSAWRISYPYPEKKSNLKRILEKDKMDQKEDNVGPAKPKVLIRWLNYQFTFYSYMFLSNLMSQLGYYMLQLSPHSK
jgi:hypothetical protein